MVGPADADDAKMLLDIPFLTKYVTIDKLALNLADICLDNNLPISCKSLLCFAKIGKVLGQKVDHSNQGYFDTTIGEYFSMILQYDCLIVMIKNFTQNMTM